MIAKIFALAACLAVSAATVPQIKICDDASCPSVSRVGMGTLHLGDKISGLSDPGMSTLAINHPIHYIILIYNLLFSGHQRMDPRRPQPRY